MEAVTQAPLKHSSCSELNLHFSYPINWEGQVIFTACSN